MTQWATRGVSHYGLANLHSKVILRQNKNDGNSNIFHHAKIIIFKKSSKRNQKSFKIILL
jgi:hypothetical protein